MPQPHTDARDLLATDCAARACPAGWTSGGSTRAFCAEADRQPAPLRDVAGALCHHGLLPPCPAGQERLVCSAPVGTALPPGAAPPVRVTVHHR